VTFNYQDDALNQPSKSSGMLDTHFMHSTETIRLIIRMKKKQKKQKHFIHYTVKNMVHSVN